MAQYFLGIDAGTTVIKAVLFNEEGNVVQESSRENEIIFLKDGGAEIDLEIYWHKVSACVRQTVEASKVNKNEIKALAISANGVTFMPVDKSGNPLRKAFSYLDERGAEETRELIKEFGQEKLFYHTGHPHILPIIVAVKTLWMKHHEPDIFNRFYKLVMVDDYLMFKLTGVFVTDPSLAGTTGFVKLHNRDYYKETMEYIGITEKRLCKIKQSGTAIGNVQSSIASELGLSEKTLVVCGALDQAAGCIGSGNITTGILTECTGTVLALNATVNEPLIDVHHPIPCFCHAVPEKYIMLPWCLSGGRVLKWFRDEFFQSGSIQSKTSYSDIIKLTESIPAGSEGLLMLPHLAGANSPEFNEQARGVFFNIDVRHTRAHFVRAILESIGYMLRRNVEMLRSLELPSSMIRAIGGGARSRTWNQIKADILQIPVTTCEVEEAAALGAAVLAAVGSGYFASIEEGCKHFVRFNETFEPDKNKANIYDDCYNNYVKLYERVENLF
ncbi:MAG: FGGY family carbohydrate kinase [Candidatus Theseobacter exili]|nr:FGGY family carbohydrate kinase [Candidatus Theseobacter exili]